jgi:flagellar protein FliO/FliZ
MFHRISALFLLMAYAGLLFAEPVIKEIKPYSSPVTGGAVVQWFIGLLIVLVIIVGSSWLLRRYGNISSNAGKGLKILGGVSVGSREKVLLLQAGKKQIIIGVAPGRVSMLHVLDEEDIALSSEPKKQENEMNEVSFSDHLKKIAGKEV